MVRTRRSQRTSALANKSPSDLTTAPRQKRKTFEDETSLELQKPGPKRFQLTQENLRKHRRSQQREEAREDMGRTRKTPTSSSRTTVTTTDRQFGVRLTENNVVYETFEAVPPQDVEDLKTMLSTEREVPISAHRYWPKVREAKKQMAHGELSLESLIVESMLANHDSPGNYLRFRNDQWTEVDNEITVGISDPKPDVTEAYTWSAYPPGTREDLEEMIVSQYGYAVPTFAMESKGPSGDHEQAIKQAAYDGAVMTHAALAIDGHVGKDVNLQLGKTKAITVTLSAVEINVFANHAIWDPSERRRIYHQYPLMQVSYLKSKEEWDRAHSIICNAQQLALELANDRVADLRKFHDGKKATVERVKVKQVELQAEALAKTKSTITPPPSSSSPGGRLVGDLNDTCDKVLSVAPVDNARNDVTI